MRRETLRQVLQVLRDALARGDGAATLRVLDPDLGRGRFAGELVEHDGELYVHRPWRLWVDLAERLGLRMRTPRAVGDTGLVDLGFERLGGGGDAPSAGEAPGDATERYGAAAPFARISRAEDPGVLVDLDDALDRIPLPAAPRILDLGCNTGELLALLVTLRPALADAALVGVDHSASALAAAAGRLPRGRWIQADLAAALPSDLGRFDLVIIWATLQSGALDDRALLRTVVQDHLAPEGSIVLGVPNCRYLDGETVHGARMKNFRQPELGLLFKDVAFYRKYLQQHRRQVFVTGRDYILVTAVPSTSPAPPGAA